MSDDRLSFRCEHCDEKNDLYFRAEQSDFDFESKKSKSLQFDFSPMKKIRELYDDESERTAVLLGTISVGLAACNTELMPFIAAIGAIYMGGTVSKTTRIANTPIQRVPFLDLEPEETVSLIKSQFFQFTVGVVIGYLITLSNVLQILGLNACTILEIGPLT